MQKLKNTTLVFLIKKSHGQITDICLAMKKRGFGINRWNGVGGKVEQKETIEEAAKRETKEEVGVDIKNLNKVAELAFYFPNNPLWDNLAHVYFSENWRGNPIETEEMNPKWFAVSEMPFSNMWPDDEFWVPEVIKGNLLKAIFRFGEGDVILDKKIDVINEL